MILTKTAKELQSFLDAHRKKGDPVGFVPTMGALHAGHLSLIDACKTDGNLAVSSIFINPRQFNNPDDFQKYPVTLEKDIALLEEAGCDILFLPSVAEIFPPSYEPGHYDLGYLESILEGEYRPGHFQGVCDVVDRLLGIVLPSTLYLGVKDYQQCMVIKKMIAAEYPDVQVQLCPTVREPGGLAMSSRNQRLDDPQKQQARHISKVLGYIREHVRPGYLEDLKQRMYNELATHGLKVDYVEIANAVTLKPVQEWDGKIPLVALVAAFVGDVRLIDNMLL